MDPEQAEEFRRRYLADQVETATPAQRLMMLFGRLQRDLRTATEAFSGTDLKVINDALVHAQQILFALRDPLDDSPLGKSLGAVYSFCINELIKANLEKNKHRLPPVIAVIDQIAGANLAASMDRPDEAVAAPQSGAPAPSPTPDATITPPLATEVTYAA
jgi:flagellar protein FliS